MKRLLAVGAVIGACSLMPASASAADANGCDKYASTAAGSTITTPEQLHTALAAGETGCFRPGVYTTTNLNVTRAGVTFKSVPGTQAVWRGRIVIQANNVTVRDLRLDGSYGQCAASGCPARDPSPTIGSTNAKIINNDISNRREAGSPAPTAGICINQAFGGPNISGFLIEGNRIHDCGRLPATEHDHGIYISWGVGQTGGTIRNNTVFDNADRGVQLAENARSVVVDNNTIDGNAEGLHYGGEYSEDPTVYTQQSIARNNIVTNSTGGGNLSWHDFPTMSQVPPNGNSVTNVCLRAPVVNGGDPLDTQKGIYYGFRDRISLSGDVLAPSNVYANRGQKDFRRANGCSGMGAPDSSADDPAFSQTSTTLAIDSCGTFRENTGYGNPTFTDVTGSGCATGAKYVVAEGWRAAYINGINQLYARQGGAGTPWLWQRDNVKAVDVSADALMAVDLDGSTRVKEGSLTNGWNPTILASTAIAVDLAPTGQTFALITSDRKLWGKENGFWGNYSQLADDTYQVKLGPGGRLLIRLSQACPSGQYRTAGKIGGILTTYFNISSCGESSAIALGGTRFANVAHDGSVRVKEDLNSAAWTQVLDAGQTSTTNANSAQVALSSERLVIADACGGVLRKDLVSTSGTSEPLRRVRDCGSGTRDLAISLDGGD